MLQFIWMVNTMDEEGKRDFEMFDIRQVLEEIKKYSTVPKEDILEFLLQDKKGDTAFFYYKNMLLQLVDLGKFDSLMNLYDLSEKKFQSPPENEFYTRQMLDSFCYGNTDEFKKIINFATDMTKLIREHNLEWNEILKLIDEWNDLKYTQRNISREMNESENEQEEKKKNIEEIESKISSKESNSRGVQHFLKKLKLKKEKAKLEGELSALESKKTSLQENYEQKGNEVETKLQQIREIFSSIGMQELGERTTKNIQYINGFGMEYRIYS